MLEVTFKKDWAVSLDGVTTRNVSAGESVPIPESLEFMLPLWKLYNVI